MQIEVGAVLEGRVTGITGFGAFVALPDGKSGLVHISEVANTYVSDIHQFLSVGQTVRVRGLAVSPEGKISLSVKRAEEPAARAPARPADARPAPRQRTEPPRQALTASAPRAVQPYVPVKSNDQNFEDKLKQFMQVSDSKMSGNRLFEQQKRSRGRRK
jgi:S1 RNA binding domain protein